MGFAIFWYVAISVLWVGFFVLEGFDFGVGMLHVPLGRDEAGRRTAINTIGPLWDGNEVWLIVAGAAIFAAFPGWYATMFSALYLPLVLLLVALILRGVSFEYRGKGHNQRWRRFWDGALTGGSLVAPLLLGVALGDLLHGLPINASQDYTGSFLDLLQPYGLYFGVTLVALCVVLGAAFIALKTVGDLRERAVRLARIAAPMTAILVFGLVAWTHALAGKGWFPNPVELIAVLAAFSAAWAAAERHEGWTFAGTALTVAACLFALFVDLYPRVMVSSTSSADSLTVSNTAAGPYSLKVMTVVAAVFLPLVLGYQAWTYYVFRRRLSTDEFPAESRPQGPPSGESVPLPRSGAAARRTT